MPDFLIYEQDGPLVTLTMNQPEQRNPLTGNTAVPEFLAAIDRIHDDRGVRCVILTGNGPSFCAGGDIREMKRQATPEVSEMDIRHDYRRGIQRLTLALFNLEVPVIAAVNGHAIGAGLDLACMCDIRIASEKAKFAESFIKLGIIPGDGGAWLLPRIVGMSRAAELAFTGDMIDAQQALAWNLVSRVVPHDELMAVGARARGAHHAARLARRAPDQAADARGHPFAPRHGARALRRVPGRSRTRRRTTARRWNAFLEKRAPRFSSRCTNVALTKPDKSIRLMTRLLAALRSRARRLGHVDPRPKVAFTCAYTTASSESASRRLSQRHRPLRRESTCRMSSSPNCFTRGFTSGVGPTSVIDATASPDGL